MIDACIFQSVSYSTHAYTEKENPGRPTALPCWVSCSSVEHRFDPRRDDSGFFYPHMPMPTPMPLQSKE